LRILTAIQALWYGIVDPRRVQQVIPDTAVAVFAAAVLLLSLGRTAATFLEAADERLQAESAALSFQATPLVSSADVDLTSPQRQFTAVFGGALLSTILGIAVLAAMLWIMTRFLTNEDLSYSKALESVSAASSIEVLKLLITTPLHLLTHTNRSGLHAGLFVDPSSQPFLFAWLQRLDLFNLWLYLAAAIIIATWQGLHYRFGIVVGGVTYVVVQVLFGGFTLIAWMLSLAS
jgi:hypothetical protein